jgi:hypothetical protein
MEEIRLPQHVVKRIERRWAARFAQTLEDWQRLERAPFLPRLRMRRSAPIAAGPAAAGIPEARTEHLS